MTHMARTLTVFCMGILPFCAIAEPGSAIEFYDSTGANKTVEFGWQGSQSTGKFIVKEEARTTNSIEVQSGNLTVSGDVEAGGGFVGDGSRLTGVPAPTVSGVDGLLDSLKAKADTGHVHTGDDITGEIPASKIPNSEYMIDSAGTAGKVWKSNGEGRGYWGDDNTGTSSGGTITGVTADSGLAGGGTEGSVSLKVKYGGKSGTFGTEETVARSDHNHTGVYQPKNSYLDDLADGTLSGSIVDPDFGNQAIKTQNSLEMETSSGGYGFQMATWTGDGSPEDNYFSLYGYGTRSGTTAWHQLYTADRTSGYTYINGSVDVEGNISSVSGTCCSSDLRYKKNIKPLALSLDKICKLQGITYEWNSAKFPDKPFEDREQIGLIAQDVEKVVPEIVHTDKNGYKSLYYDKLTAVLIEAVKEQQQTIKAQEDRISALEKAISSK